MQQVKSSALVMAALLSLAVADMDKRQTTISQLQSCPGVLHVDSGSTVCCVGGSLSIADLTLSSCAGWPICTGPVTISSSSTPRNPPLTCAAVIDMGNPSYASLLASATASIAASGTNPVTTIDPTGAAATPGSSASSGGSATATSASRSGSAASASATNAADHVGVTGTTVGAVALAWLAVVAGVVL